MFLLLLCTSIGQYKEMKLQLFDYNYYKYIYITMCSYQPTQSIKLQFLENLLTNKLVILTILFLQCNK